MTRTYLDLDPMKNSWLTLIASDGGTSTAVLPPGSTVRLGHREIYIPAGESKSVRWDGPFEVVAPRFAVGGVIAADVSDDLIPIRLSGGHQITDPDEAEALGLTVDARRMRATKPKTLREHWDSYAVKPLVARWTSRVSFVVGLVIGAALIVGVAALVVWLVVVVWGWVL